MTEKRVRELHEKLHRMCVDHSHEHDMTDQELLDALSLTYNAIVIRTKTED